MTNNPPAKESEIWNTITTACKEASKEVLGHKERSRSKRATEDEEVKELSKKQKELRQQIKVADEENNRKQLQKERNKTMREIERKLQDIEEEKIQKDIEMIEKTKDDPTRMFKAISNMKRNKPKERILVENTEGLTANEDEAVQIVSNFFNNFFNAENQTTFASTTPSEMNKPFTSTEVKKAIASLKNNKSAGID